MAQDSLNMSILGHWDDDSLPTSPGSAFNDIWGYAADGNEYAIIGGTAAVFFFDVTDPKNPRYIDQFPGGDTTIWRDMKTYRNRAYAVSDRSKEGLMIFDLSDLPSTVVKTYQDTSFFAAAHNIYIDEDHGRLYVVGSNRQKDGMVVLDISQDPDEPTLLAAVDLPEGLYVHDVYVKDHIAYCSHGFNGFYMWDFTNPQSPKFIASTMTNGYNHSSWPSEDGQWIIYAEEYPPGLPLGIIDISEASTGDIEVINTFKFPLLAPEHENSTPHNPFIKGDYAYVSHYEDGIQVINIVDPMKPFVAAYYDIKPNESYNGTTGFWGVYPFLPSGNIIASDTWNGLFIFKMGDLYSEENIKKFKVYPNPTNANITLEFARKAATEIKFEIFAADGKLLYQDQFEGQGQFSTTLDISYLATGVYFLRTIESSGKDSFVQKIFKY